jgi:retron-type reverse transcriptase
MLSTFLPITNCSVKFEVIFCVQAVLSPLLSNLVLDELDRELERRGHRFVRYADDANIYVRSQAGGSTGDGEYHALHHAKPQAQGE